MALLTNKAKYKTPLRGLSVPQWCFIFFVIIPLMEKFPTEKKIVAHFLTIRYPDDVTCNYCGPTKLYPLNKSIKVFRCNGCTNSFSPLFEKSSTDLREWFYAIYLFLNGKRGVSGLPNTK